MPDNDKDKREGEVVYLPIEWQFDNVTTRFANQLVAQFDQHEVILSFFEIRPPMIFGDGTTNKQQAAALKSVKAECVARVVVSRERFPDFVRIQQEKLSDSKPEQRDEKGAS